MKIFCPLIRFCLAALFLLAGIAKLMAPFAFADSIAAFGIFPEWSINVLAMTVPMEEVLAAGLLVAPRWKRPGALLALALSAVFLALFWSVMARGQDVSCSCFGALEFLGTGMWAGLIRAALMVAASSVLYLAELRPGTGRSASRCLS